MRPWYAQSLALLEGIWDLSQGQEAGTALPYPCYVAKLWFSMSNPMSRWGSVRDIESGKDLDNEGKHLVEKRAVHTGIQTGQECKNGHFILEAVYQWEQTFHAFLSRSKVPKNSWLANHSWCRSMPPLSIIQTKRSRQRSRHGGQGRILLIARQSQQSPHSHLATDSMKLCHPFWCSFTSNLPLSSLMKNYKHSRTATRKIVGLWKILEDHLSLPFAVPLLHQQDIS